MDVLTLLRQDHDRVKRLLEEGDKTTERGEKTRTELFARLKEMLTAHEAMEEEVLYPALKAHPKIAVRMGVHSGPVSEVTDLNGRTNIAGAGINMAQRVMDCGDAGHILLSKRVADDLEQYRQWRSVLHDLGECEVKHGARIHLFNLCDKTWAT